jgi:hypothetical protein
MTMDDLQRHLAAIQWPIARRIDGKDIYASVNVALFNVKFRR